MTDYKDKIRAAAERFNPLRPSDPMVRALQSQARARSASLDDLLAALDVDLLPWQRESLGRWVEHKLTFRMR